MYPPPRHGANELRAIEPTSSQRHGVLGVYALRTMCLQSHARTMQVGRLAAWVLYCPQMRWLYRRDRRTSAVRSPQSPHTASPSSRFPMHSAPRFSPTTGIEGTPPTTHPPRWGGTTERRKKEGRKGKQQVAEGKEIGGMGRKNEHPGKGRKKQREYAQHTVQLSGCLDTAIHRERRTHLCSPSRQHIGYGRWEGAVLPFAPLALSFSCEALVPAIATYT